MIIVKNRELLIPNNERYIGTTYDTETENRIFQVPRYSQRGVDLAALTFRLDIQYANESYDTIVLDKEIGEAFVILIWRITSATLQVPGTMYIGLRAVDDEATVKWSSFSAAMYVERHLNTPGNYGGGLTEIEQMEQDHQYMLSVVNDLKANLDYAHDAEAWAQGTRNGSAVPSSDKTYQKNSKYYSEQANASKNAAANSATAAAGSATQAAATVADTNTRFNNAVAAVTVDTEVQDARVGADGTQYTVLKNRLDAEHSLLKSHLVDSNSGKETFGLYARFEHGAIQNGTLLPNYSYRVSTNTIMSFDRDIVVDISPGYKIGVFYFVDGTYTSNSGYVTGSYKIPKSTSFKLEIAKTPEVIVEANVPEFVNAITFMSVVGAAVSDYTNEFAETLISEATYNGYFKLNSTALTSSTNFRTKKYVIPTGTTKVYIQTRFSGLMGVAFSDITDPTVDYLGYPANCTKDPVSPYVSLADHIKTYTLDRYYKCVYVPYYIPWGEPTVIAYRETAFDTLWKGIRPLEGKNVLVFGDSITYTSMRWRDEFFRLTRANELACISYPGAHLTDYDTITPLDGNYATTADGGVHNVVCNQVYYWINNTPTATEPDIIIISAGTNDANSTEQLETDVNVYTDATGWIDVDSIARTTFEGAMRWITSKLRTKYTNAVIVFASPIQSAQSIHAMSYQLAKEAKMERVCKCLSAKLIKATSESGITGEFETANANGRYLVDGLHPNELGGKVLGAYYANAMETMCKDIS